MPDLLLAQLKAYRSGDNDHVAERVSMPDLLLAQLKEGMKIRGESQ